MRSPPRQPDDKYFNISQKAAERLGYIIDGNGLRSDQVIINKHDTEVHRITGTVVVRLISRVAQSQQKGDVPHGLRVGSKDEVFVQAENVRSDFLQSNNFQRRILEHLEHMPGHGWGIDPVKIALPELHKEFSVSIKCLKCGGAIKMNCTACNITGAVPCRHCVGQGTIPCQACNGTGRTQQDDTAHLPCIRCNGQGRIVCPVCNGRRVMSCALCAGQGFVECGECSQSGCWTEIYSVAFEAELNFVVDLSVLSPPILTVIEKLQMNELGRGGHAEIFYDRAQVEEKNLLFPATALLPIAHTEFFIDKHLHPAIVVGLNAHIVDIDPFMDILIKPGIAALINLNKGTGEAGTLLEKACHYKLLQYSLSALVAQPKWVVYQEITKTCTPALSEKYANALVSHAAQALQTISQGNRLQGLVVGTLLLLGLEFLYHLELFRTNVLQTLLQNNISQAIYLVDVLVWGAGYLVTVYLIKWRAAQSLRRFLPEGVKVVKLPAVGVWGIYALCTSLIVVVAAYFLKKSGI